MRIGITFDYSAKGINRASKDMKKLGATSKTTALAIKKGQLAWAAAGAAALKVVKDSIKAIQEEERSIAQLSNALRTVSLTSANSQVEAFIANLEQVSAVADDQLRPAFSMLVSQIKDVAAAEQVLTLATEISAATAKDLTTVTTALTKAYAGNRKGLTTLGVGMDATYLKTAPLDEVIGALNDKFSGSNQALLNSYQGRIQQLSVAFGTMKEGIGKGLLDAFEMVFGSFNTGTQAVADFGTTVGDFFRGLGVLWTKVSSNPIIKLLTKGFGTGLGNITPILGEIVEMGKTYRLERERLHADDARENKRLAKTNAKNQIDAAVAAAKKVKTITSKKPAAGTGLTDEERLKMQFDIERIGLFAALKRTTDEASKARLEALIKLNTASYDSELANITKVDVATVKLAASTQGVANAVANVATNWAKVTLPLPTMQTGLGEAATTYASQIGKGETPAPTNTYAPIATGFADPTRSLSEAASAYSAGITNININGGSLIAQQNLTDAIAEALNTAARAGTSFSQIYSRL